MNEEGYEERRQRWENAGLVEAVNVVKKARRACELAERRLIEEIRASSAKPSAIARMVGVSRQRIHQIIGKREVAA